ncbi:MAG: hypothetical protein OJF49_002114 [Ktedonobacterales bacterium]|jgi:hypothetical protein|nr:MAG: hypothetical protein OJF49_002114 [Ktedonobacterales bacterium]
MPTDERTTKTMGGYTDALAVAIAAAREVGAWLRGSSCGE